MGHFNKIYNQTVNSLTRTDFQELVALSKNRKEIFTKLGLRVGGTAYRILNKRIEKDSIDISHFRVGGLNKNKFKSNYADILIENSSYTDTHLLKMRLVRDGLLEYECFECKNDGIYNNKPLTLELHHQNKIRNDHRIENLTILCPNCHRQAHDGR